MLLLCSLVVLLVVLEFSLSNAEIPFFDSAGKYGAGLALEELGMCLEVRHVPPFIVNWQFGTDGNQCTAT